MNNVFSGKTMENVRERTNIDNISHTEIDQIIKRQSKLGFKGISQRYNNCNKQQLQLIILSDQLLTI